MTCLHRAGAALLCLFLAAPAVAGDGLRLYVNSREFDVAVAPVDEASMNADNSILYQRAQQGEEWEALGPCRKIVRDNGDVRFTREVEVPRDGTYFYTSRPIVSGEVENPPTPDSPPQAAVVVDTLPPIARIIAPGDDAKAKPGETVTVSWQVEDEHLGDGPTLLTYSGDGGRSWNPIGQNLPAVGDFAWKTPADLSGPALVRVAAVDLAGNVGRSLRSVEAVAPPPPKKEVAMTKPELPAKTETVVVPAPAPEQPPEKYRDPEASWLYYLMALNLMRQNKPEDALQYYWLAVKEDPEFVNAWADIGLAYNDLGAYQTARQVVEKTRELAPDRIDLMHLLGETYHAEGMEQLTKARSPEERGRAKASIDQAVSWYGKALDTAAKEWKLAEQAASFYRLGEICYYVNLDPEGARAYWEKILKLHIPTPNPDLMQWSAKQDKRFERRRYERNTDQWVALHTWQNWARGYLEQMNERERRGIVELMKAQRINQARAKAREVAELPYAGNSLNPGREDGRSIFSLSANLGSPDDVAACTGKAGGQSSGNGKIGAGIGGMNEINLPAHMNRDPLTSGYSFYGADERAAAGNTRMPQRGNAGAGGMFSIGGQQRKDVAMPMDPYAFPGGGQSPAPWSVEKPYGNQPIR